MIHSFRKHLSMPGLLRIVGRSFDALPDDRRSRSITLKDCLLSALAVFHQKFPSLLQFDRSMRHPDDPVAAHNLRHLFGITKPPSDTTMRERLDEVNPRDLRRCFTELFAQLQRGKVLEAYTVMDGHLAIALDGTGTFSSHSIHCDNCCVKNHQDGSKTYYEQALVGAIVHRDIKEGFPLVAEPIRRADGTAKNDCERHAAKRFLTDLRREHPHLKAIIIEDGLASNGPHVKLLKEKDFRFILGAKPKDHELLFSWFEASDTRQELERLDPQTHQCFEWDRDIPLNDAHFDTRVHVLRYTEVDKHGKKKVFSWVTDLPLTRETVPDIVRIGRRRWAIENETFQTLKDGTGYSFEHNYGHGNKYLADVFVVFALLGFLMDQVQSHCCALFQRARDYQERNLYLWDAMRTLFRSYQIDNWKDYFYALSGHLDKPELAAHLSGGP